MRKKISDLEIGDDTLSYGKVVKIGTTKTRAKVHFDSNAVVVFDLVDELFIK